MGILNLRRQDILDFIARICISAIFINAIPIKITRFSNVVEFISSRGIAEPLSAFLLVVSIIFLVSGSILVISGKYQKIGSIILLAFIIPTTIIFHMDPFETRAVLMNLGLIGGLLLIYKR